MNFTRTERIPDIVICEPKVFGDHRGYFMECYKENSLIDFLGKDVDFCQDNESLSTKGVLRGLHYQIGDFAQTKLVRVIQGVVIDVAVDIRKGSPTFGEHVSIELSETNKRQLYIPKGFAHGFLVLSEEAVFSYKVDAIYSPENERSILYNDPMLNIDWRLDEKELILSKKDVQSPILNDATDLFEY